MMAPFKREFQKFRLIIELCNRLFEFFPKKFFNILLVYLRYVPSKVGIGLRYCCLKRICKGCGENVVVFPGVHLTYLENCVLGNNISIRENSNIGCNGGLFVGDNVMISQGVSILTTNHDYKQTEIPMRDAAVISQEVTIEEDTWIGAHAVITSGVTIRRGSVVGSGSVVTKDIPAWSIVGGIPSKVIGSRVNIKKHQ